MSGGILDEDGAPVRFGTYIAERLIGRGGMGSVFAARDQGGGATVALKVLMLGQLEGSPDVAVERFHREVRAMRALEHPGIIRILDAGQGDSPRFGAVLFYAMELIQGETLHELLRYGAMFPEQAAAVAVELADALQYAHRRDIIHRDVKPANVFLSTDRRVLIGDFGIARLASLSTLTATGTVMGTLQFLAPEQLHDQPADPRSDLFALGALTYTLITGRYLRPLASVAEILRTVGEGADVSRVRALPGLEPGMVEALARAVEPDPRRRFQSAHELRDALKPFVGALPLPGPERVGPSIAPTEPLAGPLVSEGTTPRRGDALDAALESMSLFTTEPQRAVTGSNPLDPSDLEDQDPGKLVLVGRPSTPVGAPPAAVSAPPGEVSGRRLIPRKRRRSPGALRVVAVLAGVVVLVLAAMLLLRLRPVVITVDSIPPGARVMIGGEEVGRTPLRRKLPRRRERLALEVIADGRDPYREELQLPVFGSPRPVVVAMPLQRAAVALKTSPGGATMFVDGVRRCTSPCRAAELTPGEQHLVHVNRPGCVPIHRVLVPGPGQEVSWELSMQPLTSSALAMLKVIAPPGPLRIDGVDVAEEMSRGELLFFAGVHLVEWGAPPDQNARQVTLAPASVQVLDLHSSGWDPQEPPLFHGELDDLIEGERARERPPLAAYVDYAIALLRDGKPGRALRYLERAIVIDRDDVRVHRGCLIAAAARKDDKLALGHMHHFLNAPEQPLDAERVRRVSLAAARPGACGEVR